MSPSLKAQAQATDATWEAIFNARLNAVIGGSCATLNEAQAQTLQLEFNAIQKYTILAKRRRNACMGACGLPVEILANIFAFAQVGWTPSLSSRADMKYDFGWMNVTHVCYLWRSAAIGTAHLWPDIRIMTLPPRMATDILRRSQRLPLSVYAHNQRHKHYKENGSHALLPLWLCEPILPRIEKLSFYCEWEEFQDWRLALRRPMPSIRDLSIDVFVADWHELEISDDNFLGGEPIPSLKRLTLGSIALPETSPLYSSNLTFLSLSTGPMMEVGMSLPTTATFRSQLLLMPNLEELRLRDYLPEPESEISVPHFLFPPAFKKLHVFVSKPDIMYTSYLDFWSQFHTRFTTAVVAVVSVELTTRGIFIAAAALAHFIKSGPQPQELWLSQAAMMSRYSERPREAWGTRWDPNADYPAGQTSLADWAIDARQGRRLHTGRALASAFQSRMASASLSAINFSGGAVTANNGGDDPAGLWLSRFGGHRAVKRITVPYVLCEKLFNALGQKSDDGEAFKLFPALETIVFFHRDGLCDKKLRIGLDVALFDLLDRRRERGTPLRELLVDGAVADWRVWDNIGEGTSVSFF
ncbi:unnamed protein product [Peniophora sp. CBMAI 1063]|nr:unnamed protein product [Peniophora sp. CBMAI 1063]